MKQAGATRIILATALVAISIMAAKTLIPSLPLAGTVIAAAIGLVLIFSLYRSDARRRRKSALDSKISPARSEPMTSDAIRHRLESRPLPQIGPGPMARDRPGPRGSVTPAGTSGSSALASSSPPTVLERVQAAREPVPASPPALDLTDSMMSGTGPDLEPIGLARP